MTRLNAEWIDFRKAYRLYDPTHSVDTIAYVDDLQVAVNSIFSKQCSQIAITSWTPRGKNLGHGWSRRIYP